MIDESYDFNKTWYIKPTNFQKGLSLPEMSNELPVIFPLVEEFYSQPTLAVQNGCY